MSELAERVRTVLDATPRPVSQLMQMTGLPDKEVRNGIDWLRANGVPVWNSKAGFWVSGRNEPCPAPGDRNRWKREPE